MTYDVRAKEPRSRSSPSGRAPGSPTWARSPAAAALDPGDGHEAGGAQREVYLVGPQQARGPAELRTEVQWPIR